MRKSPRPIDALFSRTRQGVLAATFGQPERWWFLSELASRLRTTPSSLQRELDSLAASRLLRRRRDGKRVYYQAESNAAIFPELRGIVIKTLGVSEEIRRLLHPLRDRVRVAFLYGSAAEMRDHAASDIDLMLIGSVGLADLAPRLSKLEKTINRHVDAVVLTPREYREKIRGGDHFVTAVLKGEKIFITGSERELEELAG